MFIFSFKIYLSRLGDCLHQWSVSLVVMLSSIFIYLIVIRVFHIGYCGQGNFIYYTHPSNPHKFYMVDPFDLKDELKMECPDVFGDKMVFNDSIGVCSCLYDGPVDTCEDEEGLVVYVPFDDHIHDISCDQIPSESMGEVYLVPGCVKGNNYLCLTHNYMTFILSMSATLRVFIVK